MKSILFALAMTLAASPVLAQDEGGEPALVEALVVNARTPGPAWWSVSKGRARVWVLALSDDGFRANDRWDLEPFERRIAGGGRIIHMQTSASTKLSRGIALADKPWIDTLTPAERERFEQVANMARVDPVRYAALKPDVAALALVKILSGDEGAEPEARLLALAGKLGAKSIRVGGRVDRALRASMRGSDSESLVCLNWVTEQLVQPEAKRAQAEAWMRGDVRRLVLGEMTYSPCQQGLVRLKVARQRQSAAMAKEIARTLDKGGNAVALIDLVPLLMRDGVLDQLRKRGYVVRTPAQLED